MISAKENSFCFIEKEVEAQERNYEQRKEMKKPEKSFAGKEVYGKAGQGSKTSYGRDGQTHKAYSKPKKKEAQKYILNYH